MRENRVGEKIIDCLLCGGETTMLGTKLCDRCWELKRRIEADPELTREILAGLSKPDTKLCDRHWELERRIGASPAVAQLILPKKIR